MINKCIAKLKSFTSKHCKLIIWHIVFFVSLYLIPAIYIGTNVYKDNKVRSDVIIVLGAQINKEGKYNPCLIERVNHGVSLFKDGYSNKIIFSGGTDKEDGVNEAEAMKKFAIEKGIPEDDIIIEPNSTSTYENIKFSKDKMSENELKTAIIVTEAFHEPRADLIATHFKINHTVSPALNSPCWDQWKFIGINFLREPLALYETLFQINFNKE